MGYFETNDPKQLQLFNFWAYGIIEKNLNIYGAWELAKKAMENTTLATQINAALLETKEKENTLPITEKERKIRLLEMKRKADPLLKDFYDTLEANDLDDETVVLGRLETEEEKKEAIRKRLEK